MGSPISRDTFLQRAQARFGDAYDYGEIVYKSYKTPINIRCRIHPVKLISITPEKHLQTSGGCKFCLRQSRIRMLERELHRDSVEEASLGLALAERVRLSSGGSAAANPSGAVEQQQATLR
jgi:hypothetical protein